MKKLLLSAATAVAFFASASSFAQTPGVLLVNEFSKGTGNVGPYIELLVGSTSAATGVDVRNWIVDDNNGIFNGGPAAAGKGITTGHLRLVNDAFWSNVSAGTLIVLFDNSNAPNAAGLPNLGLIAAASAAADGTFSAPGAIYVAVGKSPYVAYKSNLPNASPATNSYCGGNAYQTPGLFNVTALATDLTGDGIQTRCPGCLDNLQQEPSFYSGAAFGSAMSAVTGSGIGGALVSTNPAYTTFAGKVFALNAGTTLNAPGVSANWTADTATTATQTPGSQNSTANGTFITSVAAAGTSFRYTACAQPTPMNQPKGALVVTEISNGPSGECEYVVLAVAPCSASNDADNVDVRGWILDDNNGVFNPTGAGTGKGITNGHFRLAFNAKWAAVPVGSSIVVYNGADNCIGLPTGTGVIGGHNVYYIDVNNPGTNTDLERYGSFPTSANGNYCNPNGLNTPYVSPATSYAATVGMGNGADGFQVRCPGCNDMNNANPEFYHGVAYGPNSGPAAFASASGLIGGPALNFTAGAKHRIIFKFAGTISSSSVLANPANFDTAAALTSPATVGDYSASLFNYLTGGTGDFPCCGAAAARPAVQQESVKAILGATDVKVYPNPAKAVLNIEFPAAAEVAVKLFDMNGRIVAEQAANGKNKVSINVASFTPGLYFYQVISNGNVQSGKVTVGK